MVRWIEHLINPFGSDRLDQPPDRLGAFFWRYVSQAWGLMAVAMTTAAVIAVINAALFVYVGVLIDRTQVASTPGAFFAENADLLWWVAFLLVAAPVVDAVHILLVNQAVVPAFTNLIRWQTHRYVLRQSLSFYQNDFAGRIANKVMQAALAVRRSVADLINAVWYVAVFVVSALLILIDIDPLLAVPMVLWLVAYALVLRHFIPTVKNRAAAASEAYSRLLGRVVDSYTNILTVKLFSHASREDDYVRAGIAEQNQRTADVMRAMSGVSIAVGALASALLGGTGAMALWLWSQEALTVGAVAAAIGLALRITNMSHWIMFVLTGVSENVGIVQDGMEVISRPHAVVDRPDARGSAGRARRGALRGHPLQLRPGGAGPRRAGDRGADPGGGGRREGRAGRPLGCRQVDAGAAAAAVPRPGRRPHPDRRPGHRRGDPGEPAPDHRHGDPGHLAAAPLGARQHPLRPSRGRARGGDRGGPAGAGPRLHPRPGGRARRGAATTPMSASAASSCRAASASASRSPGCC